MCNKYLLLSPASFPSCSLEYSVCCTVFQICYHFQRPYPDFSLSDILSLVRDFRLVTENRNTFHCIKIKAF